MAVLGQPCRDLIPAEIQNQMVSAGYEGDRKMKKHLTLTFD